VADKTDTNVEIVYELDQNAITHIEVYTGHDRARQAVGLQST